MGGTQVAFGLVDRGWRLTQPYAAPAGTQTQTQTLWRNIQRRTDPPTPFTEAERLLRHPFKKVGRRCWRLWRRAPSFSPLSAER